MAIVKTDMQPDDLRRWKIVRIANEMLLSLFRKGKVDFEVIEGIPDDAQLIDVRYDPFSLSMTLELKIWSASFDVVPLNHAIECTDVKWRKN